MTSRNVSSPARLAGGGRSAESRGCECGAGAALGPRFLVGPVHYIRGGYVLPHAYSQARYGAKGGLVMPDGHDVPHARGHTFSWNTLEACVKRDWVEPEPGAGVLHGRPAMWRVTQAGRDAVAKGV